MARQPSLPAALLIPAGSVTGFIVSGLSGGRLAVR
jgi:hypothetical protein